MHEGTGQALDKDKTLSENGVNRRLRLLLQQQIGDRDLAVEVVSPGGQVWSQELPPHTSSAALCDALLAHFQLPNSSYRPRNPGE